jgi:hypothetical protein
MLLQEDVSSGADYYQQDLVDSVFGRGRNNKITCIINVLLQGVAHDFDDQFICLGDYCLPLAPTAERQTMYVPPATQRPLF